VATVPVMLDGKPKLLAKALADPALVEMEPGLGFASRIDEPAREPALAEGHC
jgi:hypothetical protein